MIFLSFGSFYPAAHIYSPRLDHLHRLGYILRGQTPGQHDRVTPGDTGRHAPIGDVAGAAVEVRVVGVEEQAGEQRGRGAGEIFFNESFGFLY
jgi:hypothetical protein